MLKVEWTSKYMNFSIQSQKKARDRVKKKKTGNYECGHIMDQVSLLTSVAFLTNLS